LINPQNQGGWQMTEKAIYNEKELSTIVITYDGVEYPLDITEFTARETGILKRVGHIAGPGALQEALNAMDMEAIVAMTVIAIQRTGAIVDPTSLLDEKMGDGKIHIQLPKSESEQEANPT